MTASAWRQARVFILASAGALAVVHGFPSAAAREHAPLKRAAASSRRKVATRSKIRTGHIRIENHEASTLLSLSLAAGDNEPNVVATGVPSGGSVVVALPKAGKCVYDIKASFEDWSWVQASGLDLCKDKTLKLGESAKKAPSAPARAAKLHPASAAAERGPAAKVARRRASAPHNPVRRPARAARIARTEPLKARRRSMTAAAGRRIRVENHHRSTLLTLTFAVRGTAHLEAQLLPSGASTTVALPKAGHCIYDVQVEFADDSGFALPGYNLCKNPTLNFK